MSSRKKENRDVTMSGKVPSTFLPSIGEPNPTYNALSDLYDAVSQPSVLDDIAAIVEMFIVNGELDEAAYLRYVEDHFGKELDDLIDVYENAEPVPETMPPAPSPKVLYNRVADVKVVDIGSGDCAKLSKCQAQSVVATDVLPVENVHYGVVKLDASYELRDFMETKSDSIITSYNSLTQLKDIEQVKEFDGIHILPDMEVVKALMPVHIDGGTVTYGDHRDLDVNIKGDEASEGYIVANTFASRNLRFRARGKIKVGSVPNVQVENIFYRPPNLRSTPKYDGVCYFLLSQRGRVALVNRRGIGYSMESGDSVPDFILSLEKLPLVGVPRAFVLLRVNKWRGYYPFHGANCLESFTSKVRILLSGCKVFHPGDEALAKYASDGQIFRIAEIDFRYKARHTVDVYNPGKLIQQLEDKYGYVIDCEPPVDEMLKEYTIHNENGKYRFEFERYRDDKTNETSVESVARMMAWI